LNYFIFCDFTSTQNAWDKNFRKLCIAFIYFAGRSTFRCSANEPADVGGGSDRLRLGCSGAPFWHPDQVHPVVIAILFIVCVDLGFFLLHMLGS
jgi:hypothetical protein